MENKNFEREQNKQNQNRPGQTPPEEKDFSKKPRKDDYADQSRKQNDFNRDKNSDRDENSRH